MSANKKIPPHRQQLCERIIDTAMIAFTAQGIRAVRMDDIAKQLGISKRTLYELYETKEELLFEGVYHRHNKRKRSMMALVEEGHGVMEIVLEAYRQQMEEIKVTVPQFYDDLKKYPRVLQMLEEEKKYNRQRFTEFLRRGISEGFFRSDLNYDLVPLMFDAIGHYIMSQGLYRHYDIEQVFKSLVFTSLRGICTAQGAKALDEGL